MRFSFHAMCALQTRVRTSGPADLRSNTAALDKDVSAPRGTPSSSYHQVLPYSPRDTALAKENAIKRIARYGWREARVSDEAGDSKRHSAKGSPSSSYHHCLPFYPRDTALAKEYAIERIARNGPSKACVSAETKDSKRQRIPRFAVLVAQEPDKICDCTTAEPHRVHATRPAFLAEVEPSFLCGACNTLESPLCMSLGVLRQQTQKTTATSTGDVPSLARLESSIDVN